ncbi:phosphotransferase family protein [Actinomadura parmotrematis]|uniref:Aminoglycoside phosphotransferase family protein n=1 Tax=Actinomadura parmotrematis TaxID=2864039 RepID=A0ABS7G135_9ACTN|nr:aminoglycoside phosphotransferase family protein [Actinomadura parmotrematis]MBW8485547.1 aminoglycoside phosphotransferase family protein [Actinomadura parmotrematis]
MTWLDLYEQVRTRTDAASGYYNHNIRAETDTGSVIVRIPIPGADVMDLQIWREEDVLTAIAPYVDHAPRLLHVNADPRFQIHSFLPGDVLNDIAPRGVPVPSYVLDDIVALFAQLVHVPREKLPPTPPDWPDDGDSAGFGRRIAALTQWVYDTFAESYADLFATFGVPTEPLAAIEPSWAALTRRPSVCVHADVHRKNMIVNNGTAAFLDWELALWGDPVYDLAVHIHKMGYLPEEQEAVTAGWLAALPAEYTTGWEHDLPAYLAHERINSAIIDSVRYSQIFANDGPYPYPPEQLVETMAAKLNAARVPWGIAEEATPDEVRAAFAERAR